MIFTISRGSLLWVMTVCIWCLTNFENAPYEHLIPESLDGYAVTDKVCESCNNRFGGELEATAQGFPLIVTARKRLGLVKVNPPPAPNENVFKRFIAKVALEFVGESDYELTLDPVFHPWREFVLYGTNQYVLSPNVTIDDIYAAMPGYRPIIGSRNLRHVLFIDSTEDNIIVAVQLYGQLLCKVRMEQAPRQVQNDHLVMSIKDGASKMFLWNRRGSWKGQKMVIPGKKRKRRRRKPEPWFR